MLPKISYSGILILAVICVLSACSDDPREAADHQTELPSQVSDKVAGKPADSIVTASVRREDTLVAPVTVFEEPERRLSSHNRINLVLCGVDSRMGERTKHADANHVLSIQPDRGRIDIYSIPRDTPADAGFTDSMAIYNLLTNVRAHRGRNVYKSELARIAGLDTVHYYVEVGFSQAMGILELLGYKKPSSTLRVLRSRKAMRGADFQRTFNQGQFIKQAIRKAYPRVNGFWGEILIRGGLVLVDTDMDIDVINNVIERLEKAKFDSSGVISVEMRPKFLHTFAAIDFFDERSLDSLHQRIAELSDQPPRTDSSDTTTSAKTDSSALSLRLYALLDQAVADSGRSARKVLRGLQHPFQQRIWLQVEDIPTRIDIRNRMALLLIDAHHKRGHAEKAQHVDYVIRMEDELFFSGKNTSLWRSLNSRRDTEANANAAQVVPDTNIATQPDSLSSSSQ